MIELKVLRNEKMHAQNTKQGTGENQFDVKLDELRKIAQKIKFNQELALSLWERKNKAACFLAILLMKPTLLSVSQLNEMLRSISFVRVADWLPSADKEKLLQEWLICDRPMTALSGWPLIAEWVLKNPDRTETPKKFGSY